MVSKKFSPVVLVAVATHNTCNLKSAKAVHFCFCCMSLKGVDRVPSFLPSILPFVAVHNMVYLLQEDKHHSSSSSSKDKEKERDKERKHKDEKKDKDREHKSSSSSRDKEHKSSSSR